MPTSYSIRFHSVPTHLKPDQFQALLLYFVACLISNALDAPENEECVFVRRSNAPMLLESLGCSHEHRSMNILQQH